MTCIQFNYAVFIQYYPEFSNPATYPQATLQLYWNKATTYINACGSCGLTPQQRVESLNLMTAHLGRLNTLAAAGEGTGLLQGATIDKVSVTLTPPPENTQWAWWLNQTPYGQQLLALFDVLSVGGWYTGGYPTAYSLRR